MENESKVFSSGISRDPNNATNQLYDLINIVPALPVTESKSTKNNTCSFVPRNDKYYAPKKKNGVKVKTVRDIRSIFEADIYSYLPADLEKQKSFLLRKIRLGSARDEKTKETAISMMKSSSPITRSSWQMLMNINPEKNKFPTQYVLWNGKYIQINGSRGGNSKFIYKYDIGKIKEKYWNKSKCRKNNFTRKRGLLQNSLNVNFKPGPLSKKNNLDTSYQKFQFGEMKLVTLPKPGLDIQPSYGKPLAPTINTFLQNAFLFNNNGIISQKWADFAVSVLGTGANGTPVQLKETCNVTFDLDYKCFQNRILMRNDSDIINQGSINTSKFYIQTEKEDESVILSEVSKVVEQIIDSVEISLKQNEMYFGEDEPREVTATNNSLNVANNLKEKGTKRKYGELDRLDVTVIRIPENIELGPNNICHNTYCALGCICDSLKCTYNLKTHCGRLECMFQCKCDFTKYKLTDSFDYDCSDIIKGLVNLDKKLGQTLAKEEHKFHQTVIVTDEKSILLKSRKRNWKTSKKYAEFYSSMQLKAESVIKQVLSVSCINLKIKNVEPWCMVHNLYKCFCKGKFTEGSLPRVDENITSTATCYKVSEKSNKRTEDISLPLNEVNLKPIDKSKKTFVESLDSLHSIDNSLICSRTFPYDGRKYNDEYYRNTNTKIKDMERNDTSLRKRLVSLIHNEEDCCENILNKVSTSNKNSSSPSLNDVLSNVIDQIPLEGKDVQKLCNKKLVTWLESSYKQYKSQNTRGQNTPSLHPPRPGTMALYSWEFILSRYREKKNHFLISQQQPFRIFMAIDIQHTLFDNCININDIALSDLDKYPITVKNLLTNATEQNDNFCILCGLSHCWELVGTVTKVNKGNSKPENSLEKVMTQTLGDSGSDSEFGPALIDLSDELNNAAENVKTFILKNTEQSKWFVMTIENDFTEIQFFKKGFFVKYESIMKAINVAKISGKTVKLSSQNCANLQNSPNFGIYAVPSDTGNYVFIGPYEKDETLGIETIKSLHSTRRAKNTRGTWITTNKVDNLKVIDNPLLYMPLNNTGNKIVLSAEVNSDKNNDSNEHLESRDNTFSTDISQQPTNNETVAKIRKPIRIPKTNDFYQLAPNGLLKQIPLNNKISFKRSPSLLLNKSLVIKKSKFSLNARLLNCPSMLFQKPNTAQVQAEKKVVLPSHKPIAEIAPQIKDCNNIGTSSGIPNKKIERGMFVLKPEEINKRSFENQLFQQKPQASQENKADCNGMNSMDMDIENFLESSVVCTEPKNECYIISDDEDGNLINHSTLDDKKERTSKDVYIVCKNINNLGWIRGMQNAENDLSFEFPGFKYSEFYKEEEALSKITQVLSRKIYVPKHIHLEWQVLKSLPFNVQKKLETKDLCTDYVLTKNGLQHKFDMMMKIDKMKDWLMSSDSSQASTGNKNNAKDDLEKNTVIIHLEETSKTLEEESSYLWDQTMSKKGQLLQTFSKTPEGLRKELAEKLTDIKNTAEDFV